MKNKQRNLVIFSLISLIASLLGCGMLHTENAESIVIDDNNGKYVFDESIKGITVWAVYWNLDVDEEISKLAGQIDSVSYFEVYFDGKYELVIPEQLMNYYKETKSESYNKYISFVNDVKNREDNFSLKDVNMLKKILSDTELQNKYVDDIISIASDSGFDGIEIDFEGIKNDIELWNQYIEFIKNLYGKCGQSKLKLRIILEPNTPVEKINFVEGPVYVMMCYNLHGSTTEPGEKANNKFINELIDKMERVSGTKEFAVASGGFDWNENGKIVSVDENKAEELLNKYKADKKRDSDSGCLYFEYKDKKNIKHEVWYADKYTLNGWMKVINERGYKISLWKLGGNRF
ncbi:glycosyl hydrolase family 18 protein [uncultured Clostridium sp.]|uniref:glycosyl hydrolase family 18 protein n=1 Tax=uncultured Clostridium sp. TaxID=59620 RepID=UPI0025E7FD00|nr:glycosyl hydrolase family 18 protein [uncultured Clostridium sp.]